MVPGQSARSISSPYKAPISRPLIPAGAAGSAGRADIATDVSRAGINGQALVLAVGIVAAAAAAAAFTNPLASLLPAQPPA